MASGQFSLLIAVTRPAVAPPRTQESGRSPTSDSRAAIAFRDLPRAPRAGPRGRGGSSSPPPTPALTRTRPRIGQAKGRRRVGRTEARVGTPLPLAPLPSVKGSPRVGHTSRRARGACGPRRGRARPLRGGAARSLPPPSPPPSFRFLFHIFAARPPPPPGAQAAWQRRPEPRARGRLSRGGSSGGRRRSAGEVRLC